MMYNCVSDTEKIQNRENTKKDEFGESRSHVFQFFLSFPPTKNQAQLFSISRSNKALFNLGDSSPQISYYYGPKHYGPNNWFPTTVILPIK